MPKIELVHIILYTTMYLNYMFLERLSVLRYRAKKAHTHTHTEVHTKTLTSTL